MSLIDELPEELPADYQAALKGNPGAGYAPLQPLNPWNAEDEATIRAFLREWQPLGNRLFPIEYYGNGLFACLHLLDDVHQSVVAWDITADLGEQPWRQWAESWSAYRVRLEKGFDPRSDWNGPAEDQRLCAERERKLALEYFDQARKKFDNDYYNFKKKYFNHDGLKNVMPKAKDWRPIRFAVHDHLIGVMAYRFNPKENSIDAVGFATRDHTNFARGSATAALLATLLCEWARHAAQTIRFVDSNQEPLRLPYEVALLGWIHGAETHIEQEEIRSEQAARLLLALAPFQQSIRKQLLAAPEKLIRTCLTVFRRVWTPLEAAALVRTCPQMLRVFDGGVSMAEQAQFAALLQHARGAVLLGHGVQVLENQGEVVDATAGSTRIADRSASPLIFEFYESLPYAVLVRPTFKSQWGRADEEPTLSMTANRPLVLVGCGDATKDTLQHCAEKSIQDGNTLVFVPLDRVQISKVLQDELEKKSLYVLPAPMDTQELDRVIIRRLNDGRRLRS